MNLFKLIEKHSVDNPQKVAIYINDETIDFKDLYNSILYNCYYYSKQGIKADNIILLDTTEHLDFIFKFMTFISLGCWVVPKTDDNAEMILQKKSANYIYIKQNALFKKNRELSSTEKEVIVNILVNVNSGGIYHLSSGTTSEPHICIRNFEALIHEAQNFKLHYKLTDEEKIFSFCNIGHSFALGAALMTFIYLGCTIFLYTKMTYRDILKRLHKNQITLTCLVPFIVNLLNNVKDDIDLSSIRVPLVGAGKITKQMNVTFRKKFNCKILSNYGSTETGTILSSLNTLTYSSLGIPFSSIETKIINPKGISANKGELLVKSNSMFEGYLGEDSPLDGNGYYHTKDIVRVTARGFYMEGRKTLFANVAGKKVNPQEVEEIIKKIPYVIDCVVCCNKNTTHENKLMVYIVSDKKIDFKYVKEFCKDNMSEYKIPMFYEYADKIQRDPQGKVKRKLYYYV